MNIHRLYHPFLRHFRTKRMRQFCHIFGITENSRVLDVGGDLYNWSLIPTKPSLTIVNLYSPQSERGRVAWIIADGRHLPFTEAAFDIVYSNSVIEHLSNLRNQEMLASEIDRVGIRYFVQTPSKWFVVEPHLLTPFVHWLPKSVRAHLLRNCTLWGLIVRPSRAECQRFLDEVDLLSGRRMRALFPEAHIIRERVLGLTKSFVAVK